MMAAIKTGKNRCRRSPKVIETHVLEYYIIYVIRVDDIEPNTVKHNNKLIIRPGMTRTTAAFKQTK